MYNIRKFGLDEIDAIKDIWQQLEKGPEMTYFQRFDWYKTFIPYVPRLRQVDCAYWVVYRDEKPILIAPLWILKKKYRLLNRKCVRIIANWGFTDYINFIYSDFDPEACRFVFERVVADYGHIRWYIIDTKQKSSFCDFVFSEFQGKCQVKDTMPCPALELPADEDSYFTSLTKSVRQNIRTAHNRAEKDGIVFSYNFDDTCRDECSKLREVRNSIRKVGKVPLLHRVKKWVFTNLIVRNWIKFNAFVPITVDKDSKLMTMRNAASGELVSFFNYGYDPNHKEIVVMAAGFNPDYIRYSPGLMLMYEYICLQIKNGNLDRVDFTRGDEPYKLQLGAKIEYNNTIYIDA